MEGEIEKAIGKAVHNIFLKINLSYISLYASKFLFYITVFLLNCAVILFSFSKTDNLFFFFDYFQNDFVIPIVYLPDLYIFTSSLLTSVFFPLSRVGFKSQQRQKNSTKGSTKRPMSQDLNKKSQ